MEEMDAVDNVNTEKLDGKNFIAWAKSLLLKPVAFFSHMPKAGGFGTPVLYALGWLLISGFVELLMSLIIAPQVEVGMGLRLAGLFIGPFIIVTFGFLAAGILFVIWHLMGSKENYQTAFRTWAFLSPLSVISALLGPIPFVGTVVVGYGFYLLVVASQKVHGVSAKKAWIVWGTLFTLLIALTISLVVAQRSLVQQDGQFPDIPALQSSLGVEDGQPLTTPEGSPVVSEE